MALDFLGDLAASIEDAIPSGLHTLGELLSDPLELRDRLDLQVQDAVNFFAGGPTYAGAQYAARQLAESDEIAGTDVATALSIGSRLMATAEGDPSFFSSLVPGGPGAGTPGSAMGDVLGIVLGKIGARNNWFGAKTGRVLGAILARGEVNIADVKNVVDAVAADRTGRSRAEIRRITRTVTGAADQSLLDVQGAIDDAVDSLRQMVQGAIDGITGYIERSLDAVSSYVDRTVSDVSRAASSAFDAVLSHIEPIVRGVAEFISDAVARLSMHIGDIVDQVAAAASAAYGAVQDQIALLVADVGATLRDVGDSVTASIGESLQSVAGIADTVGARLSESVAAITADVQSGLGQLTEITADVARSVRESVGLLGDTLGAIPESTADRLTSGLESLLQLFVVDPLGKEQADAESAYRRAIAQLGLPPEVIDQVERGWMEALPRAPIMRFVILLLSTGYALWNVPLAIGETHREQTRQELSKAFPLLKLQPNDAVVALLRGIKSFGETVDTLRRQGYSEQDAAALIEMRRQFVPVGEVLEWWLRGIMGTDDADTYMQMHGYTAQDVGRLRENAMLIPGPADLIHMATREAFSPDVVSRFGQAEDFPEEFASWGAKQGLSREWCIRYWAAHWSLPSPNQGFEMLQRGIIGEDDLKLLLRALDVMPYWRDRLIQLSYNVLTRVDVRRMYEFGVMDEPGVERAHRNMGYSPEDARRLTDFTVKLAAAKNADEPKELTDLSRSTIIGLYDDAIISRNKAEDLLMGAGYSREAATVLLDAADVEADRKQRKDAISLVLLQSDAGILTFEEAEDKLGSLGLTTTELERAMTQLLRQDVKRTKVPARAEIEELFRGGVITEDEALSTLQRAGFALRWARSFVQLWKKPKRGA